MAPTKTPRPRAGLGLSSAISREQMTTRATPKVATRKPAPLKSTARKPIKGERHAG